MASTGPKVHRDVRATHDLLCQILEAIESLAPAPSVVPEAWPLGSIYTSRVNVNPAVTLGYGTWESYASGRVLIGHDPGQNEFNTPGAEGGSKQHTLSIAELPPHTHAQSPHQHGYASRLSGSGSLTTYEHGTLDTTSTESDEGIATLPATAVNAPTGDGQAFSILPPHKVVFFWERVA